MRTIADAHAFAGAIAETFGRKRSQEVPGANHPYSYTDFSSPRACSGARAATAWCETGDRVGTLCWNSFRHLDLFRGTCYGAVLHTLNLRLPSDQIAFIIIAEDQVIFVDASLFDFGIAFRSVPTVKQFCDSARREVGPTILNRSDMSNISSSMVRHIMAEWTRQRLHHVYTPDDRHPKGVLYTHRAIFMHSFAPCDGGRVRHCESDTICRSCRCFSPMLGIRRRIVTGSKIVLTGRQLQPVDIAADSKRTRDVYRRSSTIWIGCRFLR